MDTINLSRKKLGVWVRSSVFYIIAMEPPRFDNINFNAKFLATRLQLVNYLGMVVDNNLDIR